MSERIHTHPLGLTILLVFGSVAMLCLGLIPTMARCSRAHHSHLLTAEIESIMAEAGRDANSTPDDYSKTVSLSALAEAQKRYGNAATAGQTLHQARQAADRVVDPYSKQEAFMTLALAQSAVGDRSEARRSLQDAALAADQMPTAAPKDWASRQDYERRKVGEAQVSFGHLADAQNTADSIHDSRTKSILMSLIAEHQLQTGNIDGAIQTVRDIDSHDKAIVLSEVAEAQIKAGKNTAARQTITDAIQTAGLIDRPGAQAMAWQAIAAAQARTGEETDALLTAAKSRDSWTMPDIMQAVVETKIGQGNLTGAQQTAEKIMDSTVKCGALQAIAEAQSKAGDIAGAKQSAHEAYRVATQVRDRSDRCFALSAIADAQITAMDLMGAQHTLQEATEVGYTIADHFSSTLHLSLIAEAQIKAGDLVGARKNIDMCAFDSTRIRELEEIAEAQIRAGNNSSAKNTLEDATATIKAITAHLRDSDIGDLSLYAYSVGLQERIGVPGEALKTLRQLHTAADRLPTVTDRSIALSNIVSGLTADL